MNSASRRPAPPPPLRGLQPPEESHFLPASSHYSLYLKLLPPCLSTLQPLSKTTSSLPLHTAASIYNYFLSASSSARRFSVTSVLPFTRNSHQRKPLLLPAARLSFLCRHVSQNPALYKKMCRTPGAPGPGPATGSGAPGPARGPPRRPWSLSWG